MNDNPEATNNTAEVPAEPDTTATEATAATSAPDSATTEANREAARYRRRLRETETERDALVGRLAVLHQAEAERIAAAHLADGADIWRDGADVTALLDDAGNVDKAKVTELAADIATQHPHWTRKAAPPKQIHRGGLNSGASTTTEHSTPTWASLLNGDHRQ